MKRIFTLTTLLLFFAIAFTTCQKIEKDTPQAIKKLIRKDSKSGTWVSVVECECNEKMFYLFKSRPFPDAVSPVYDKNGNLLCTFGGMEGSTTCKGCENMIEKRIIWTSKK